ncbi:MAG: ComEC/Rec2 family competence protein [Planctomycetes bacterium]|nr:ComEC/Rec2 family competence protein [Planctomycetota bacterium]
MEPVAAPATGAGGAERAAQSSPDAGTDGPVPGLSVAQGPRLRAHRPLLPVAPAFAAGIWAADRWVLPFPEAFAAACALLAVCAVSWRRPLRPTFGAVALLLAVAALGAARVGLSRTDSEAGLGSVAVEGAILTVRGTVAGDVVVYGKALTARGDEAELPQPEAGRRSAFVLEVDDLRFGGGWRPAPGLVRVSVFSALPAVARGDRVQVTGRLARPPAPLNPGQFDYRLYLERRGISWTLRVSGADAVTRRGGPVGGTGLLSRARRAACAFLEGALPGGQGRVASALLLGARSALPSDLEDAYQRSGTIHVLAVSGLHVVFVAAFLWGGLRLLGVPRRAGLVLLLAGLVGYAGLTGGSPSVVRATVMAVAWFGAELVTRRAEGGNSLAAAALALLAWAPGDLWDLGFELSTLAVVGLLAVTPRVLAAWTPAPDPIARLLPPTRWERFARGARVFVVGSVATTLGAWGATWPLVAHEFHLVTPGVLVGNLFVCPLVALALGLGLMLLSLSWLPALVTWPLGYALGGVLLAMESAVRLLASLPGAWMAVPVVSAATLVLYYGSLGLWSWVPPSRRALAGLAFGLSVAACSFARDVAPGPPPLGLRATFLAVGHGTAVLLEFPDGTASVYDVGCTGAMDAGAEVAAPVLWSRGVRAVDRLYLSHPDADHYDGAASLAERVTVREASTSPYFLRAPQGRAVLEALERRGVPRRTLLAPTEVGGGGGGDGVSLRLLWPPGGLEGAALDDNDLCLSLLVEYGGARLLLCGDVEAKGIDGVLSSLGAERVDCLAVPHHGSKGSLDPRLVALCRGGYAVISSDARFVSPAVRAAYAAGGARVLETWRDGAITFTFLPGRLEVETFR